MKATTTRIILWMSVVILSQGAGFTRADWMENFEEAKTRAKADNRFMLLDFTGSDWCGWCIKLDKEVFSENDFKNYANEKLVLVKLDFPRRSKPPLDIQKQNQELAREYGIRGYPTIILLDPNGEKIGRTGYQAGGPEKYVQHLEEMIKPHESKFGAVSRAAEPAAEKESGLRTWTSGSGSTMEASYYRLTGNIVELQKPGGKKIRIGLSSLSQGDQEYLRSIKAIQ